MATFKVGQKVRVIGVDGGRHGDILGATGTVIPLPACPTEYEYAVDLDGIPVRDSFAFSWGFHAHQLAPLTDPGADAFMERIKKFKPYDEPKVSVTTEHGTALFPK